MTSSIQHFRSNTPKCSPCMPMENGFSTATQDQHVRSDVLILSSSRKTVYHRRAWWGPLCTQPETLEWWRHQDGGVACPNFSWFNILLVIRVFNRWMLNKYQTSNIKYQICIGIQIFIRIIYYPINAYPDSKLSVLSIPTEQCWGSEAAHS